MTFEGSEIFSRYSPGAFALVSGAAMIGTIFYIIWVILPTLNSDSYVFLFSMLSLIFCAIAPPLYYLDELSDYSDVIGKFTSGAALMVFGVLLIQVINVYPISLSRFFYPLPRIIITGLLALLTSFIWIRGVVVPLSGDEYEEEYEEEEEEIDEFEEDFEKEEDRFPEEEDEPWM